MKKGRQSLSGSTVAKMLALALVLTGGAGAAFAQPVADLYAQTEQGALKLLHHTYRVGAVADGNQDFDFVRQGGQEILFFFDRYSVGAVLGGRHDISFLYQPLELTTEVNFKEDVKLDGVTFAAGTPMRLTYGFPFYRLTYRYRFLGDSRSNLAAGAAIQLRNASIRFAAQDGGAGQLIVSQNLGIVPALAVSGRLGVGRAGFLGFEATGIYASSALFNGASFDFEGSILDASLRGGVVLEDGSEVFLNGRFFGGSARGVSEYASIYWAQAVSRETANYIAAVSFTAGATLKLR